MIWRINGFKINELKMARDEDDVWRLYFGSDAGDVGYFSDDTFSDLGSAYEVKWQTKHRDYGSVSTSKTLGDCTVTLQPGGAYTPTLKFHFDYGARTSANRSLTMKDPGGATWDTAVWDTDVWAQAEATRNEKVYGAGSGSTISMEFSHTGANQPFWVSKVDHQVDIRGEDTGSPA